MAEEAEKRQQKERRAEEKETENPDQGVVGQQQRLSTIRKGQSGNIPSMAEDEQGERTEE